MTSQKRWLEAQEYERSYWAKRKRQISSGQTADLGWYAWRAEQVAALLDDLGLAIPEEDGAVLEIGSGPVGIVGFFPAPMQVAVDPLADFYASESVFARSRNASVDYRQGVGEDLPCDDTSFDLVVMENCIDHVQDIPQVMEEIKRVLKPGGALYLTVNCRTPPGYWVHRFLSRLRIDAGHPHTFTWRRVRGLLREHDMEVRHFQVDSFLRAFKEDLTASGYKDRIKALLGVSEFLASAIAVKTEPQVPARS